MGAGALGSAAANVAGQAYDSATGGTSKFNVKSLLIDTAVGAATGGVMHYLAPYLPKCFDGDTLVAVAPQVAMVTSKATNKATGKAGKVSKAAPAPKIASATKKIREIRKGDAVATRNPRTGKTEYKPVRSVFVHNADALVAVSIANQKTGKVVEVIKSTPEHPFFTTKGLVAAGQLGIGTELVTRAGPQGSQNGQSGLTLVVAKVEKIAVGPAGHPVYNLEVEDDHTYFVGTAGGGLWVHNDCVDVVRALIKKYGGRMVTIKPNPPFPHVAIKTGYKPLGIGKYFKPGVNAIQWRMHAVQASGEGEGIMIRDPYMFGHKEPRPLSVKSIFGCKLALPLRPFS